MFSKTPLQKLSLGAAGAIWLALGSVESANAASFSNGSISQPFELASIRLGNGEDGENSSEDAIKAALIAASVIAFGLIAARVFDQNNDQKSPDGEPNFIDDFKFSEGLQVQNNGQVLTESDPGSSTVQKSTPVPTPALLPGLLALGWKVMQKRRSEQSGVI